MSVDRKKLTIQLRNLGEWREMYYNGTPLVSDAIYDDVEDQAKTAAEGLPNGDKLKIQVIDFLARVGAPIPVATTGKQHWKKAKHKIAMGSLNKAQPGQDPNVDFHKELETWFKSCTGHLDGQSGDRDIVISDKCDGISIGLLYVNGKLDQAITRGDGSEGEDITRNVVKMKGIVHTIKGFDGFIRGEIVLRKSDWKAHFPTYSNPRNAASGIAKRLDGTGSEHLTVLHYQMVRFTGLGLPSKAAEFKILTKLGAAVPNWYHVNTLLEGELLYTLYADMRGSLPQGHDDQIVVPVGVRCLSQGGALGNDYDIDGLVYEFNDVEVMLSLGNRGLRPRGAVAYKFPHTTKLSVLRGVRWQVGNSGRITPVAEFDSVRLDGANVKQASLHNLAHIAKLATKVGQKCLFVGDQIVVSRRNMVIPYVESLLGSNTLSGDPVPLTPPTKCPVCDTDVTRDGEYLMCPADDTCPAQIAGAIKRWVTKIGLKGVGGTLIDALCDQGIIADAADLYDLDKGELSEIRMDGRRVGGTADTVVDELQGKMDLPLHVFVGSLNIHLCSRSTCKTILDAGYDTIDKMRDATYDEISTIPGMGRGRGKAFTEGMVAKAALINKLLMVGITIKAPATGAMKGMKVCMTGTRDPDISEAIEAQGGTLKSSVTKDLSLLIAKDPNSTSGKAKKARAQGTEIIGIDEARTRLGL